MIEPVAVLIRRAVPGDAAALAELASRTFRETFAADNRPEDMELYLAQAFTPARQLAEITASGILTLLADADGLLGFAQLRVGAAPACVTTADPVELGRFYVDRAWHGRGVAQRLMASVMAEARSLEAGSIWLGVWEHNHRAASFYRKCGFAVVGAQEFRLGHDLQTDRVMACAVPPA